MGLKEFRCWRWPVPLATAGLVAGLLWPAGAGGDDPVSWWLPKALDACHMPAFLFMGCLWGVWLPREGRQLAGMPLLWFGLAAAVMMEPMQLLTGRHMSMSDAVANVCGWTLGVGFARLPGRRLAITLVAGLTAAALAWPLWRQMGERRSFERELPEIPAVVEPGQVATWWQAYGPEGGDWGVTSLAGGGDGLRFSTDSADFSGLRLRLSGLPGAKRMNGGVTFELRGAAETRLTLRIDGEGSGGAERVYHVLPVLQAWNRVTVSLPPEWARDGISIGRLSWFRSPGEEGMWFELRGLEAIGY